MGLFGWVEHHLSGVPSLPFRGGVRARARVEPDKLEQIKNDLYREIEEALGKNIVGRAATGTLLAQTEAYARAMGYELVNLRFEDSPNGEKMIVADYARPINVINVNCTLAVPE